MLVVSVTDGNCGRSMSRVRTSDRPEVRIRAGVEGAEGRAGSTVLVRVNVASGVAEDVRAEAAGGLGRTETFAMGTF